MTNRFFSDAEMNEVKRIREMGICAIKYSFSWFSATRHPLFLFGAGLECKRAVYGSLAGTNIVGIIDNNPLLQNTKKYGLDVYSLMEARNRNKSAIIVVTMDYFRGIPQVMQQCKEAGFDVVSIYQCRFYSDTSKFTEEIETLAPVLEAMDIWADEDSREVYRKMVRYRAGFDPNELPPFRHERQYFEKFIPTDAFRNFADAGAYTGDTYLEFVGYTKNNFENYYAFEPDHDNYLELKGVIRNDPRVHMYNAAVSDFPGVESWKSDGMASKMSKDGEQDIWCLTLDETLLDRPVSLIKMDIEGAEPAGLSGAKELLRRQKPSLAICVYHELDHLWSLPLWIKDLGLGYRLFLRHYCDFWNYDTICYALP